MSLTLAEFLDTYGQNTTNNFQLLRWAKELKIPNFHYAMRDEIKQLTKSRLPINIIANYQMSNESGSHHVAIHKTKDKSYYFDSFGIEPLKEAQAFLGHGVYSTFKIQPDNSKACGSIALFVLFSLNQGKDFFDTVLELNGYFNSDFK